MDRDGDVNEGGDEDGNGDVNEGGDGDGDGERKGDGLKHDKFERYNISKYQKVDSKNHLTSKIEY